MKLQDLKKTNERINLNGKAILSGDRIFIWTQILPNKFAFVLLSFYSYEPNNRLKDDLIDWRVNKDIPLWLIENQFRNWRDLEIVPLMEAFKRVIIY